MSKKEKIFLIPGLMTDERLWHRIKPLLNDYELIHIPIPNMEDFDRINEYLLKTLKDEKEKINLLGFSLGGYIAFYFAYKYTNRVKKLFLLAATPSSSDSREIIRRKHKITQIQKYGFTGLDNKQASALLENKEDSQVVQIVCDMFNDLGKNIFITQLNASFNREDLVEELIQLNIPIYFSYSSHDRLLNQEAIEYLEKKRHNIMLLRRKGSSHLLCLEFAEQTSIQIKNWMENI